MVKQDYRDMRRIAQWLKILVKGGLYAGSAIYEPYDFGHVV